MRMYARRNLRTTWTRSSSGGAATDRGGGRGGRSLAVAVVVVVVWTHRWPWPFRQVQASPPQQQWPAAVPQLLRHLSKSPRPTFSPDLTLVKVPAWDYRSTSPADAVAALLQSYSAMRAFSWQLRIALPLSDADRV
jgi:hypothetical protein